MALCSPKVKDCGQPKDLPNGDFHYTTATGVNTYQAQIQYHCREPYYKMYSRAGISEATRGRNWRTFRSLPPIFLGSPVAFLPVEPLGKVYSGVCLER